MPERFERERLPDKSRDQVETDPNVCASCGEPALEGELCSRFTCRRRVCGRRTCCERDFLAPRGQQYRHRTCPSGTRRPLVTASRI